MPPAATGPFLAVSLLLAAAGIAKLAHPAPTVAALRTAGFRAATPAVGRAVGVVELAVGAVAIVGGGRVAALVVAACYVAFAGFTRRVARVSGATADCGCFGAESAPAGTLHVALNVGAAAIALLAAADPPGALGSVLSDQPLAGVPFVVLVAVATWLGHMAYTLLPDLQAAMADRADDRTSTGAGR